MIATPPPPIALSASPARILLAGGAGPAAIRVANPGAAAAVVDVRVAGFGLGLRGRPRVVPASTRWVTVEPRRLVIPPRRAATVTVSRLRGSGAEPGDHPGLVLLTTRPRAAPGVSVRMQIGVVVIVRAPGRIVHRAVLGGLRRHGQMLELAVANRGNVTERLERGTLRVSLRRRGRVVAAARFAPRELLPRTRGLVELRCPRLHGRVAVRVRLAVGGRIVLRTFRLHL